MNVVFVCKYNRFRSKIAESYFNKIMKGTNHKAKSGGLILHTPPDEKIKSMFVKHGLTLSGMPRHIDMNLLKWADLIVIIADDIPAKIFDYPVELGKKVIVWRIKDVEKNDDFGREIIFKRIMQKINLFVDSKDILTKEGVSKNNL